MMSAPLLKSQVALIKGRCSIERDNQGCHLRCWSSARTPGEATAYFLAKDISVSETPASLTPLEAKQAAQVSRERFDAGQVSLKLFLSANLEKSMEGVPEDSS